MAIDPIIPGNSEPSPPTLSGVIAAGTVSAGNPSPVLGAGEATGSNPAAVAANGSVAAPANPSPVAGSGTGSYTAPTVLVVTGTSSPASEDPSILNGRYYQNGDWNGKGFYVKDNAPAYTPSNNPEDAPLIYWDGNFWNLIAGNDQGLWLSNEDVTTPDLVETWQADGMETGPPVITPATIGITPVIP